MSETANAANLSEWSQDERKDLLISVLKAGGNSLKSYKAVEGSIKWEDIKLDGKSPEDCKAMYQFLMSKVRKYRTMQEMVDDALVYVAEPRKAEKSERLPDMPKKPLTAFSLFVRKKSKKFSELKGVERMKVFAKDWNELPEEKKDVYRKKYKKLRGRYEEELQIFRQNHPGHAVPRPQAPQPSRLFIESRLHKLKNKQPELSQTEAVQKLTEKYKKLSDKKKLKWIKKAHDSLQSYQEVCQAYLTHNPKSKLKPSAFHLSKEEQKIWDSAKGKPTSQPPKNLFMYFCNTKRSDVLHLSLSEQTKELSVKYQKLSENEAADLAQNFKQEVEDYIQAYTRYYQALSEAEQSREKSPEEALAVYHKILENHQKKKKKRNTIKETEQPKKQKAKLQDVLPRHDNNNDDDDDSSDNSDEIRTPPSAQPPQPVNSHKRKSQSFEVSASPHKKRKNITTNDVPKTEVPSIVDEADGDDALLSLWSPQASKTGQIQDSHTSFKQRTEVKTPKKSWKSF